MTPSAHQWHLAVDLGAGSGRVVAGRFAEDALDLEVVHRFENPMRHEAGHLRWNATALLTGILDGLSVLAGSGRALRSVGVDTWGVDYALLDGGGRLLEDPIAYRDDRTDGEIERVLRKVPKERIYRSTGIQFMPFNTLFQLHAHVHGGSWPGAARQLLFMPDLFHFLLSGRVTTEPTIASTSQLLARSTGAWDEELFILLGLPLRIMPKIAPPGTVLGPLRPELSAPGLEDLQVVAPASHDTASAVAAVPLDATTAYISSGTWSLVGIETAAPILSESAAARNFTNEAGYAGTNRFHRNVMGLWILESCRKEWKAVLDLEMVPDAGAGEPAFPGFIDPDDGRFFHPASMTEAVAGFLEATGQPALVDPPSVTRIILDSLAFRYAEVIESASRESGRRIEAVRIFGGGSRNAYLDQATADATGLPVLAGPIEATALGNLLVQAIAAGRFESLADARAFVARSVASVRYEPRNSTAWLAARRRFESVTGRAAGLGRG